jgi:hypothetical protein
MPVSATTLYMLNSLTDEVGSLQRTQTILNEAEEL